MLGLDYIEPELRENRGEIKASINGEIPKLVELNEIKGDLHVHTDWSDGLDSIEEMAQAAKDLGYEYIAITDHSKGLQIAHGLSEDDLVKQIQEINRINRKIDNFTILSGVEANIDKKGNLDIKKNVLKDLDFVIASIHYGFKDSEKKMTDRVLTAMHNEFVNAIGHPTGRIIYKRDPYQINLEKIFETAKELGILLEINAFPNRLDLSDVNCYKAKNYGVKVYLGTDAHNINHLRNIELGIFTARRGWLGKDDVINTMYLKDLKKQLKI